MDIKKQVDAILNTPVTFTLNEVQTWIFMICVGIFTWFSFVLSDVKTEMDVAHAAAFISLLQTVATVLLTWFLVKHDIIRHMRESRDERLKIAALRKDDVLESLKSADHEGGLLKVAKRLGKRYSTEIEDVMWAYEQFSRENSSEPKPMQFLIMMNLEQPDVWPTPAAWLSIRET